MKVQGIGNQQMIAARAKVAVSGGRENNAKVTADNVTAKNAEHQASHSQGKAKGVLRLLQEGHFKGVADVRLRINFHEQLQVISGQKAGAAAEQGTRQLMDELRTVLLDVSAEETITGLGEQLQDFANVVEESGLGEAVAGLFADFEGAVNTYFSGNGEGAVNPESLFTAMEDAFSSLISSLEGLAPAPGNNEAGSQETTLEEGVASGEAVPTTTTGAEETVGAGQEGPETVALAPEGDESGFTAEGGLPLADLTGALQEWFTARMNELQSSVGEASSLPPLSEPSGNGVAYSRFLGIYSEMNGLVQGATEGSESPEGNDGVNTEV